MCSFFYVLVFFYLLLNLYRQNRTNTSAAHPYTVHALGAFDPFWCGSVRLYIFVFFFVGRHTNETEISENRCDWAKTKNERKQHKGIYYIVFVVCSIKAKWARETIIMFENSFFVSPLWQWDGFSVGKRLSKPNSAIRNHIYRVQHRKSRKDLWHG